MPTARLATLVGLLVVLQACTIGADVSLRSTDGSRVLRPTLTDLAYVGADKNTVDIFLTDLTRAELDPYAPIDGVDGHIVHIHMFIAPKAGKTPIAITATNATVRFMVLADGAVGVYEGAGFLLPSTDTDRPAFIARMQRAPLRLITANDRFTDPLGNAEFELDVVAPRDAAVVSRISAKFGAVLSTLEPPEPPE